MTDRGDDRKFLKIFLWEYFCSFLFLAFTVFLFFHTLTQAKSLGFNGQALYNEAIKSDVPFLPLIEVFCLFLPLGFLLFRFLRRLYVSRDNPTQYPYSANIRYTLMHLSGVCFFAFLIYHILTTRILSYVTETPMEYLWMVRSIDSPLMVGVYFLGTISGSFYLTQGLWHFLIHWGLTSGQLAQKWSLKICHLLFVILTVINWLVILNFYYQQKAPPVWVGFIFSGIRNALFR